MIPENQNTPDHGQTGGLSVPPCSAPSRRVVCAALRNSQGRIICGPRHFDPIMRGQIFISDSATWKTAEQGFVDQRGNFLTREEAWEVANAAGQIRRRCGGDNGRLFSENLY